MRIGLNATCFDARPSGAKQRFVGLYGAVIRRCPDIQFIIYEPRNGAVLSMIGPAPNAEVVRTPLPSSGRIGRLLHGMGYWRGQLASDRIDLFECFNLPLPRVPGRTTVLTIHDVRSTRADAPLPGRAIARMIHRRALRRADRVITVSDTMKQELLALEPSARVSTVYNGIDPARFAAGDDGADTLSHFALTPGFLLAVGHLEPRKNYATLIAAMAVLHASHPELSLVIVGNDGGERRALEAEIVRLGLERSVTILQRVDNRQLADLYRAAGLVVFASRYEGFGIPLLEAMAARRPLATSDIAVFVELTEGKGAYFPTDDPRAIAERIAALLADPERQAELVAYGQRRVEDFGFERLAEQVETIYRRLAPRTPGRESIK